MRADVKILFATEYYHPFTPGGTAWSLALLARELRRRGEDVAIVTPSYGQAPREDVDGVPVFRFPFWRRLSPGPRLAPARDHVNPLFHLLMARGVLAAARRFGCDVIHAQEKHALVGAFFAARRLGRPIFLSLRDFGLLCPISTCLLSSAHVPGDCGSAKLQRECAGFFLDHYVGGGRLRRLRVRASLALLYLDARAKGALVRRVDGVVGVSRSILDIYGRAGRIRTDRAHVVYNLPPARPAAASGDRRDRLASLGLPDRPLVLYAGKLSLGKGFPVFVDAARDVTSRIPEVCFAAAGAGSLAGQAAGTRGPAPGRADAPPSTGPGVEGAPVRLLGSRSRADMDELFDLADIVVHPAVWPEPFSRVPLEAAAFGKPIVATRSGGTPEVVEDHVTGLLVDRGDPAALADAIARLLRDPARRRVLGEQAARAVAEKLSPERVVDALLDAYRSAGR